MRDPIDGPRPVIPVHSQPDRDTLSVIGGRLADLLGSAWQTFGPRRVIAVPGGVPHAPVTGPVRAFRLPMAAAMQ
ncbi:hypothetical protein [Methylobacterium sp. ID0610]|uniref:hypothetical protein n=1 Tax=Methylobacterium carpenticola TaxID=3344827 RepID=UPI003679F353